MEPGPHRRTVRAAGHNYTAGTYFVTVCSLGRQRLFGAVEGDAMRLTPVREIVAECWRWLGRQHAYLELDEWILMPDHLHGILFLHDDGRGGSRAAPTPSKRKTLGSLTGAFKTVSAKQVNLLRRTPGQTIGQRGYYEHAIRSEAQLHRARAYTVTNPLRWFLDVEDPIPRR